ncbi:MAG: bifunctional phosphoribosylaminoimidazolecarboxamide formyltransferase/IMP cyclohydrolase [Bacteroidetes bacterium]|nr:bifunctional phosphoribosylaminoimidazolecarboxamide formyltransferase/IMP cyclohydrolase [Bacteroidota bacterium]
MQIAETEPVQDTDINTIEPKKITNALISVFDKENLSSILKELQSLGIKIYSTGGTYQYIVDQHIEASKVEDLTGYPSILGGRVKTLHPKVFGGILGRRDQQDDLDQLKEFDIPELDLVIVDLYPFEKTVATETDEAAIIEKIDIGGISLIRAAAKNFKDVLIIPSVDDYSFLQNLLKKKQGTSDLEDRKLMATRAFEVSSGYDTAIHNYFDKEEKEAFRQSISESRKLRYGENPHQEAYFFGKLDDAFEQLHGKEISYNNLVDIDGAINLIDDFINIVEDRAVLAIIKHTNACGLAVRDTLIDSWKDALACDSVSAFGGIIATNKTIDLETAKAINEIFYEVLIAPAYDDEALTELMQKKKRTILKRKGSAIGMARPKQFKTLINGVVQQDFDSFIQKAKDLTTVTETAPTDTEIRDLLFANIAVKNLKSNAIALVKNEQLVGCGVGQTSRVDALKQAIDKAGKFKFDLKGAVMASDAFFPFPDCVEIACDAGITSVLEPGGSIKDQESIDFCNKNKISMVFTGKRHFKH